MIPRIWTIENIYILFSGGINEDITENILIFLNYNKNDICYNIPMFEYIFTVSEIGASR